MERWEYAGLDLELSELGYGVRFNNVCSIAPLLVAGAGAAVAGGGMALANNSDPGKQKVHYSQSPEQKIAMGMMAPFAADVLVNGGNMPGFKQAWGEKKTDFDKASLDNIKSIAASVANRGGGQMAMALSPAVQASAATREAMSKAFVGGKMNQWSDVIGKYTQHNMNAMQQQDAERTLDDHPGKTAAMGAVAGFGGGLAYKVGQRMATPSTPSTTEEEPRKFVDYSKRPVAEKDVLDPGYKPGDGSIPKWRDDALGPKPSISGQGGSGWWNTEGTNMSATTAAPPFTEPFIENHGVGKTPNPTTPYGSSGYMSNVSPFSKPTKPVGVVGAIAEKYKKTGATSTQPTPSNEFDIGKYSNVPNDLSRESWRRNHAEGESYEMWRRKWVGRGFAQQYEY